MTEFFDAIPGRLFAAATLLPLVPVVLMACAATVRSLSRPHARNGGWPAAVYRLFGGDQPRKVGGYLVLATLVLATVCATTGLLHYLHDADTGTPSAARWAESVDWIKIGAAKGDHPATALRLGYRVDMLTAIMVTMVTFVASLIVLFSIGYMKDETEKRHVDHEVHEVPRGGSADSHGSGSHHAAAASHNGDHSAPANSSEHGYARRGRFGQFFFYLSLFAFSMLNLLIADNLLQVFVGWELVGVCSFFLIGFYYERPSASAAANKAFIMNRIGDAGFLIGIAIAWTVFGTLNIQDLITAVTSNRPAALTDNLWLLMGLGLFLGCVGKSAQFPLHTWLPDAMEGPTPVSALIHAATMVAAGVYLVGRCYPLFSPTVLLVIAYTGAFTLFLAATIACLQTDIKRVLAYSTVSQLGYMMLALGVGGWAAGLFHLLTHAFFKALLFLGSGSVIYGLHHEQDLKNMGGLRWKMPLTAYTMLVGVLAIAGFPLLSGWYSKDLVLAQAWGFAVNAGAHQLLCIVPLFTVALTGCYMTRLWLLAFAGEPRNERVYAHAHESPISMTLPLVVLAAFSVAVGWGWPAWSADASYLYHLLHSAEPASVAVQFADTNEAAEHGHHAAGLVALLAAALGAGIAIALHRRSALLSASQPGAVGFLGQAIRHKWYFDELYAALFTRPTVRLAYAAAATDKRPTGTGDSDTRLDPLTLDGLLNAIGQLAGRAGGALRYAQTGLVRRYVLVLALTVAGLLGMLAATRGAWMP
ncbi:NADH-quinone oxidoreductase subunit L [Fimbriiglobus ruber]|uniref:NADH-ubiquinone oxidoreductase chain L n=1 Tax=Fimbriiglobus ruber TaxID=1908690 RepID=A0A225EDU2_9BACT|nr:NADH-quinone oxidoreductase subunit L [Fimbriiglobus ruber]OWK46575.1 NADH-ubiquinone oxidoreductase chain L [Fimbriiglobus ruber]